MKKTTALCFATALSLVGGLESSARGQFGEPPAFSSPVEETVLDPTCKGFFSPTRTSILTIGDDGSVFTTSSVYVKASGQSLATITKHCKGKSWTTNMSYGVWGAVADSTGSLYYTGKGIMVKGRMTDDTVVVGKLSPSGSKVWEAQLDPRWKATPIAIAVSSDLKTVYLHAKSETQLPRHPPEHRGSAFIAAFDQKGELLWFKQSKDFGHRMMSTPGHLLAVDSTNHVYLLTRGTDKTGRSGLMLLKLSPKGEVRWSSEVGGGLLRHPTLSFSPDGSVYVTNGSSDPQEITKFSADGKRAWSTRLNVTGKAVIDEVEGTQWLGRAFTTEGDAAGFANGLLYIVTSYANNYSLGFDPPPDHMDALFAAINPNDGTIASAHQYKVGKNFQPIGARALPDGSFTVLGMTGEGAARDAVTISVRPSAKSKAAVKSAK